jgi:hypothetical protein
MSADRNCAFTNMCSSSGGACMRLQDFLAHACARKAASAILTYIMATFVDLIYSSLLSESLQMLLHANMLLKCGEHGIVG